MTGQVSAKTERAFKRIAKGMTAYAAAKKEGIALSTIYRALKRLKERKMDDVTLPPMPAPGIRFEKPSGTVTHLTIGGVRVDVYSPEQVQAYAREAVLADRDMRDADAQYTFAQAMELAALWDANKMIGGNPYAVLSVRFTRTLPPPSAINR
jgi:hypothetical protein